MCEVSLTHVLVLVRYQLFIWRCCQHVDDITVDVSSSDAKDVDLKSRQQKLQHEATMALAQVTDCLRTCTSCCFLDMLLPYLCLLGIRLTLSSLSC